MKLHQVVTCEIRKISAAQEITSGFRTPTLVLDAARLR